MGFTEAKTIMGLGESWCFSGLWSGFKAAIKKKDERNSKSWNVFKDKVLSRKSSTIEYWMYYWLWFHKHQLDVPCHDVDHHRSCFDPSSHPNAYNMAMSSMSSLCLILRPLKQSVFISSSSVSTSKIIMIIRSSKYPHPYPHGQPLKPWPWHIMAYHGHPHAPWDGEECAAHSETWWHLEMSSKVQSWQWHWKAGRLEKHPSWLEQLSTRMCIECFRSSFKLFWPYCIAKVHQRLELPKALEVWRKEAPWVKNGR